ncbi:MAG: hypothetical protein PHQ43_09760 [Dehalococcoidales bacterium]|nr:hypothetical protein [Dehalococcoidales bacterium]
MEPRLTEYDDLLADVRRDGKFHPIRSLVQPFDPEVAEVAQYLHQTTDFVTSAQDFVHQFTIYRAEVSDYWRTPAETLSLFNRFWPQLREYGSAELPESDCDDMAILLCSILRNYIPADQVFCAIGVYRRPGKEEGHMWVEYRLPGGETQIIEATAPSWRETTGVYQVSALFNDEYAFATPFGLKEFGLLPLEEVIQSLVAARAIPCGS